MLKSEEAVSRLSDLVEPDWVQNRVAAIDEVGPGAGAWFRSIVGESVAIPHGAEAKKFRVSRLTDHERRTLFERTFPQLAPQLERAWQGVADGSCRLLWNERPFRVCRDEAMRAKFQDEWFEGVVAELEGHNPTVTWLAAWGGHMGWNGGINEGARLLAVAMDEKGKEGDEVFEILKQSASNQHEIGVMGQHVVWAMLRTAREEAWEFMERLLLAAQRQEGLRQSILESVHHAHPGAFKRMLRLINNENLVRFSSTVRAINVWFGFMWDAMSATKARSIIERVLKLIDDRSARALAVAGADTETAYLALWCEAYEDVESAAKLAVNLLTSDSPDQRWVGVHALAIFGLPPTMQMVSSTLSDEDIRVAARAFDALHGSQSWDDDDQGLLVELELNGEGDQHHPRDLFDRLYELFNRIKRNEEKFEPLVFPWSRSRLRSDEVGRALVGHCPLERGGELVAILDRFDVRTRFDAVWLIAGRKSRANDQVAETGQVDRKSTPSPLSPFARKTLVAMLGDPSGDVRIAAATCLEAEAISDDECARHEELLDRASGDIRTRALARLANLPDDKALACASRLFKGGKPRQSAGLELLSLMVGRGRSVEASRKLAKPFQEKGAKLGKSVQAALEGIFAQRAAVSVDDALGLAKPFAPRPLISPRLFKADQPTRAAVACIWSLERLVEANKTMELKHREEKPDQLTPTGVDAMLGSIRSETLYEPRRMLSVAQDREQCPVKEIVEHWEKSRPAENRDTDGLELVRAWMLLQRVQFEYWPRSKTVWPPEIKSLAPKEEPGVPKYLVGIELLLGWALRFSEVDTVEFFLNQAEGAMARGRVTPTYEHRHLDAHGDMELYTPEDWVRRYRQCPANWSRLDNLSCIRRVDSLLQTELASWCRFETTQKHNAHVRNDDDRADYRREVHHRLRVELGEIIALWNAGDVCDDELLMRLVGNQRLRSERRSSAFELKGLVGLRKAGQPGGGRIGLTQTPRLHALIEKIRVRVLEIELARGDLETPATNCAFALDPSGGMDVVIPALASLGKLKLARGYLYNDFSKAATLSILIRHSRPGPEDSERAFAAVAKEAGLSDERLVELALYQPRWARHVEHALGWDGCEEAVLWLRSHTKGCKPTHGDELEKEEWEGRAAELTPIPADRLSVGAVDRAWFERCYKKLGSKRWEVLYDAAKYASDGVGHTRVRLFSDAMLGRVSEKELTTRVVLKRHQDAARAIGLIALKDGDAGRKRLLARFKLLQEMRRTSRKHGGSMLQASERRAVEIGMENLAWTSGYPDPLRLQWAMEIEEVGDLVDGPLSVKVDEILVTLAVDDDGKPTLSASKGRRDLKSIPPAVRKNKQVVALSERFSDLRRQGTRIRHALEQAMCRGDEFAGGEIAKLFGHPLLRSVLGRLVVIGKTKTGGVLAGYPDKGGKALRSFDGKLEPIRASDTLRLAHPLDLLASKQWHGWQVECFRAERVQPFKQLFREVYTVIESEKARDAQAPGHVTRRYAGQQVQPRQALALFGARGWVAQPEQGVQRTFHCERLTVRVEFEAGLFTPAEIDGLTIAGVSFWKAGTYVPVAIRDTSPRLFSEVMRDLDLVVGVAHRGGVDPEASHSTVEMRAALLRETCSLLSLKNIRFENARAIIKGELGEYALHLGSGTIQMFPGGTLWVVPVHSQFRGRIFLPFADNDPKTAEVLSKALLLAKDREIQDPSILAQIRGQ